VSRRSRNISRRNILLSAKEVAGDWANLPYLSIVTLATFPLCSRARCRTMASRIIAQALVMGGTYVARALVTAYQQALVNSARQGGPAAASGAARAARGIMPVEEAAEVLGVRRDAGLKDILGQYERLFEANNPAKGGSLYLQAKIQNARTSLEREAVARGETLTQPPPREVPPSSN
jgi:mitochondrial import inner membrane translocase subunit TIM16